jgi:hypothetical protein
MRNNMLRIRDVSGALVGILLSLALTDEASAASYKVLHSFCQESLCKDGYAPNGEVVRDAQAIFTARRPAAERLVRAKSSS